MLRISCPWCGKRDEDEFTYGGTWPRPRPADPQSMSDEQWADYLFFNENPRGATKERWRHTQGCRQWLVVERDTLTHDIHAVSPLAPIRAPGMRDAA